MLEEVLVAGVIGAVIMLHTKRFADSSDEASKAYTSAIIALLTPSSTAISEKTADAVGKGVVRP